MARIDMTGMEDVEKSIFEMGEAAAKAIPEMLKAGGEILVNAQKAEASSLNRSGRSMGGLKESIKADAIKGAGTAQYIEVGPSGIDRNHTKKGVENAKKGFVLEYGRCNMAAIPWMSTANEKAAEGVIKSMQEVWESYHGGH